MEFFGEFPKIFSKLAPVSNPNISQQRAMEINMAATDGSIETLKTLGRAALAANNHLNGTRLETLAALLTGDSKTGWPAANMHTTAIDCYTGQRLVVSQTTARKNGILWRKLPPRAAHCLVLLDPPSLASAMRWMAACAPTQHM